jgi:hypothetical protein
MHMLGMIAVTLGVIGIIYGIFQKMKAGRVSDAPLVSTYDAAARGQAVASPKGAISAQGRVICQQPLVSPFSGTPCLYYRIKTTASWKDGDATKSKELADQKVAATFAIDDGSGPVYIDARKGGDFEPNQVREETKGTGLIGGIMGTEVVFGNHRVSTGAFAMGTKYTVREEVLPVVPNLYVCGKAAQGAVVDPDWRQLIISSKSRDELLAAATKSAKLFMFGGAGAFVLGGALTVVAQFMAPPAPPKSETTATSAAVSASATATSTSTAALGVAQPTSPTAMAEFDLSPAAANWKGWVAQGAKDGRVMVNGVNGARIAANGMDAFDVMFNPKKKDLKELKKNLEIGAAAAKGVMTITFTANTPDNLEWFTEANGVKRYGFTTNFKASGKDVSCSNNIMIGIRDTDLLQRTKDACKTLTLKKK